MERGAVSDKRRRRDDGTDSRAPRGYELLTNPLAIDGTPVVLSASDLIETDCPLLGSPTVELSGEPEKLNNGKRHIGYMCYAVAPKDRA